MANSASLFAKSQEIFKHFLHYSDQHQSMITMDLPYISEAFQTYWGQLVQHPEIMQQQQLSYWQDMFSLWQQTLAGMGNTAPNFIKPEPEDRRFSHETWQQPGFQFVLQSYLIFVKHIMAMVQDVPSLDKHIKAKVEFFTRQYLDAISPSNFIFSNPEVFQETVQTGGKNLGNGLQNVMDDLARGKGIWSLKMTDLNAFTVGKNIAATPGKIVFQNHLLQLIQYTPTTETVFKTPLLVLSPWINKYYNLDLRPEHSLMRFLVEQGHTVFMPSGVNPDQSLAHMNFEDYMKDGALAALDAIEKATGEKECNVIGYCIGGTLLGATLAYMAKKQDKRVKSATYFTALLDFSEPGDMGVFIDEQQIQNIEKRMERKGVLDGRLLAKTFNMLRSNDLIWSFYVQNYLKGKEPIPFDLLYWNSDGTNLPSAMHAFYLRNMYLNNQLIQANAVKFYDVPLNIREISVPVYSVAAERDHIAPWQSVYKGARVHGGKVTFVLGGSGHIAGVINPPSKAKYGYKTNDDLPDTAEAWLKDSVAHEGSWWSHWAEWIKAYAGEKIKARAPGEGKLKIIEDAPGSYVKVKVEDINT